MNGVSGSILVGLSVFFLGLAILIHEEDRRRLVRAWRTRKDVSEAAPGEDSPLGHREDGRGRHRVPGTLTSTDLSFLIGDVSGRLRAGAPLEGAWRSAWARLGAGDFEGLSEDGAPTGLARLARPLRLVTVRSFADLRRWRWARTPEGEAACSSAETIAVACRLTRDIGAPLALVLDRLADGIDEAEAGEDARRVVSAGATMSARILMVLPLLGLMGAWSLGADPFVRFVDGAVGTACGVVGACAMIGARLVAARLTARARLIHARVDPAILCDLARAGLDAGASIPRVLEALGRALDEDGLALTGRELRLGMSWRAAWQEAPPGLDVLERALEPAWVDGSAPESMLARAAARIRRTRLADARNRAEELSVKLVAPLAALQLPAFVALGVAPIVLALLTDGFASMG